MKLTKQFLKELFATLISGGEFGEIILSTLKPNYLPTTEWKLIFNIVSQYKQLHGEFPTLGTIEQKLDSEESRELLTEISKCKVFSEEKVVLLEVLESFVKDIKFRQLYEEVTELYNAGKKQQAIKTLALKSGEIQNFTLRDTYYEGVFGSFEKRIRDRAVNNIKVENNEKIPFGIPPIDYYTYGGGNRGTSALFLGRSGGGKSTLLRWVGINGARLGYRVVHFQLEGTKKECLEAYDAGWTGISLRDIESNYIEEEQLKKLEQINKSIIEGGGEIYVYSEETFDSLSIEKAREVLLDIQKLHGQIDIILFDYLELFTTTNKYVLSDERKRREYIANKITSLAVEFDALSVTATQAVDIPIEKWNNEDYVMTRSDIAEYKAAIKPFSYFITINQTISEKEGGVVRLFNDKFRKYRDGQVYRIAQSLENSRFCDVKETYRRFWNHTKNRPL